MAPNPRTFGLPEDAHELVEQRTEHVKVFKTPSGTHYAVIGRRLHFRAKPGGPWLDPEEMVVQRSAPGTWTVTTTDISIQANYSAMTLTHLPTNTSWQWVFQGIGQGDAIVYDGIPWQYEPSPWGVKSHAVVSERRGPRTYDWIYLSNAQGIHVNEAGDIVAEPFLIRRPVVIGANGEQYETSGWDLSIPFHARFSFDDSVLPDEAFPYIIDPTTSIVLAAGGSLFSQDADYEAARAGGRFTVSNNLYAGQTHTSAAGYSIFQALLAFNTSSLPENIKVRSSSIRGIIAAAGLTTTPYNLEARAYSWLPTVTADDWVVGDDLADLPLLGVAEGAGTAGVGQTVDFIDVDGALREAVQARGTVELLIHSEHTRLGTPPGTSQAFYKQFVRTGPDAPVLIVEYVFTGTVAGVVRDAITNQPIAGATVMLTQVTPGDGGSATTGVDGAFTIPNVPVGDHVVTVSAPGYVPKDSPIVVTAGTTVTLSVTLDLAPHEVVVAGIPSQEAIGNPAVLVPVVVPSIPSAEAFGIVVVSHDGVAVISIPSEESFGVPAVLVPVVVESIPSAEAFGIAIVGVPVDIRAESIRSAEAFGALAVRHGRFLTTPIARLVIAAPYSGKVSANSPLAGGIVVAAKWTGKITTFR